METGAGSRSWMGLGTPEQEMLRHGTCSASRNNPDPNRATPGTTRCLSTSQGTGTSPTRLTPQPTKSPATDNTSWKPPPGKMEGGHAPVALCSSGRRTRDISHLDEVESLHNVHENMGGVGKERTTMPLSAKSPKQG